MPKTIDIGAIHAQLTGPGAPFELTEASVEGQRLPMFRQAPESLPALLEAGRSYGDKLFLTYQGERWSFTRFFTEADALASWLHQQGVTPGDRVAIGMRNRPEWAVAFVATALLGAVPAPINSFGLGSELRSALQVVTPKVLCCDSDRLKRLAGDTGVPDCQVVLVGECPDTAAALQVHDYRDLVKTPAEPLPEVRLAPEDPALILFTSGATSRAKGVLSSQRAVCQALTNIDYIGAVSALSSPQAVAKIQQSGREPTTLTAVPLFHVSGLHAQLLTALSKGRKLVFLHRWDIREVLELMRVEQVTQFNGAPSMVRQLLAEDGFFDAEVQTGLMGLGFGGGGLSESLIQRVLTKMPDKMLGIGYGMTESNGVGAAISGDLFQANPTSSGLISPLMQVRITAPDGTQRPAGEVGEICLRGVTLMQGYWNAGEASRQALEDGWLPTGDLGYQDAQGFLYVVDRLKDIINRSGENIAAAEVESCLMMHPAVQEAAVFGVPDAVTDEAVMAVVSVTAGWTLDPEELRQHVAASLAGYKTPVQIEIRQQPLPRNPVGKLIKPHIKREFLEKHGTSPSSPV